MPLHSRIDALSQTTHKLLRLGLNGEPVYADRFSKLNTDVYRQCESLISVRGTTANEEASLCVALLNGYKATFCNHGDKDQKIQSVLDRSWEILGLLSDSLLKCQLLVACYAEVFEEPLAAEAHAIINAWESTKLSETQQELINDLQNLEDNPYPWSEISEE